MRKQIYQMVHIYEGNPVSVLYKYFMICIIAISLLPLTTHTAPHWYTVVEGICLGIFTVDYLLRWITADYKFRNHRWTAFARYPFRFISIIDLMSIFALVTSVFPLPSGFAMAKALTVFRIVRIFRYSKSVRTILEILKSSRKPLAAVGSLAVGYIIISAIVIFNVEPESFPTLFDAIYWATISLTTVGYGDVLAESVIGKTVAMVSSFFGIAIVALPAGIVTAEYMKSLQETNG